MTDIRILEKRHQNRVRIEACTHKAIQWLHEFAYFEKHPLQIISVEIDADALDEYKSAAEKAGLEVE